MSFTLASIGTVKSLNSRGRTSILGTPGVYSDILRFDQRNKEGYFVCITRRHPRILSLVHALAGILGPPTGRFMVCLDPRERRFISDKCPNPLAQTTWVRKGAYKQISERN